MKLIIRGLALAGLLTTLFFASAFAQGPAKLKPTAFAITNTTVVTKPGSELTKVTIVIRDGLVQALGADIKVPADAEIIDGKALIVYPGFVDAGNTWVWMPLCAAPKAALLNPSTWPANHSLPPR